MFDTYTTTGPQYTKPFFNPNNADEFVYLEQEQGQRKLIKYTISNQQKVELCNSLFITSQPQWGRQGWIVFSVFGGTIWKIREDGIQLTQITADGLGYHTPIFNANGSEFIQMGTSFPPYIGIFDLQGDIVDSIQFQHDNLSIGYFCTFSEDFKDGYYRYADNAQQYTFGYCKLNNNESVEILTSFNSYGLAIASCKNDQYLYYVRTGHGLFRLDLDTKHVDKLQDNCQSKTIQTLSMSPDGTKILFERIRGKQTTPGGMVIDEQSEIFMYDVHTGEETKILWEE